MSPDETIGRALAGAGARASDRCMVRKLTNGVQVSKVREKGKVPPAGAKAKRGVLQSKTYVGNPPERGRGEDCCLDLDFDRRPSRYWGLEQCSSVG